MNGANGRVIFQRPRKMLEFKYRVNHNSYGNANGNGSQGG